MAVLINQGAVGAESTAIIFDPQLDDLRLKRDLEMDAPRLGVTDRVGDRFLSDAKQLVVDLCRTGRVVSSDH